MPDKLVIEQLRNQIKGLQYDCAELQKKNDELAERCKKLASRQPTWPKGYSPRTVSYTHLTLPTIAEV